MLMFNYFSIDHCFYVLGWLVPLVDPIAKDNKVTVVPVISVISTLTLEFGFTSPKSIQVGGFGWDLVFNWHVLPRSEREYRSKHNLSHVDPIRYFVKSRSNSTGMRSVSKGG